ncbi:MAG: asparagine synthase (glutamine-hydrolyzing) [Anaeromyxobacteraceae bacterium]
MCGIAGLLDTRAGRAAGDLTAEVRRMALTMEHRGPDDAGEWADERAGLALAQRRLSIVDLSPEGHQPMASPDGRWMVVFNGEIYNHPELREELLARGARFRGHSDTEVLLEAVSTWGFQQALERFNGMFALALWDRVERRLLLARDRLGEKPLYWCWLGGTFLFASEPKALRAHALGAGLEIDRGALALYLANGYVPGPHAIWRGVQKLPAAHLLEVNPARPGEATPRPYWSLERAVADGARDPFRGDAGEAVDALEALLRDAVRMRMQADVPLGAFLSGGIDSSTVVALMQAQSSRPVRTFTIGFGEAEFDEAKAAKAVAAHLGTDHTELYVTPEDALAVVPLLPTIFDEPFADASQIPTYLVAKLAREHVTVSLSGDAGDELFGGYSRYAIARRVWRWRALIPGPAASAAGWLAGRAPGAVAGGMELARRTLLRGVKFTAPPADHARRLARLLRWDTPEALYAGLLAPWNEPAEVLVQGGGVESSLAAAQRMRFDRPLVERMMAWDTLSYLPDDILVKVDRASMAVSLEARVPLLDHRVVELAWRMPLALKVDGLAGKLPLRGVLARHVPRALVERPKQGFGVPVDAWLRGPLRTWMLDLLSTDALARQGHFRPEVVARAVREHLSGERSRGTQLWPLLMFQAWLTRNESHRGVRGSAA